MSSESVVVRVEKYINRLNQGQLFTFSQVLSKAGGAKDTVSHALAKLQLSNKIISVKKGFT